MRIFRLMVILFSLFAAGNLAAETPRTMAQDAQKAYESGAYAQALEKWEELRSLGYLNGNIFYNLGNTVWQMGEGGRARWYYLRGLLLDPRNDPLRNNLQFIEDKLGLSKPGHPDEPWGWVQALPWWKLSLSFFEILQVAAALSLVFFGVLLIKKWRGRSISKWFTWGMGISWLIFICLVLIQGRNFYFNSQAVIIQVGGADLLSAPASEAKTGQHLPEGSKVSVVKNQGDFSLIKVPAAPPAWVEAKQLGSLQF
jgi:hypothetical protein